MALDGYTSFDGSAGDLTTHVGQLNAAFARHPTSVAGNGNNYWMLSDTGSAYCVVDQYQNVAKNNHALYLIAAVPSNLAEYDVHAEFQFFSYPGDQIYGISFELNATLHDSWRLVYLTYWKRWELQVCVAGVAYTVDDFPDEPDAAADTIRTARIARRVSGSNVGVSVYFDGSGTASLEGVDGTETGGSRIGLFGQGINQSGIGTGIHVNTLAVGTAGFALPGYVVKGPAWTVPATESSPFTASLAHNINPGSVVVTPSLVGLSGTVDPPSVTLTDGARSAAFTVTPAADVDSGTITFANDDGLEDAPPHAFAAMLGPLARLAAWESRLVYPYATGANPYVAGAPTEINQAEIYDPLLCILQARDYIVRNDLTPTDWSAQIAAGIDRWRDYLIAAGTAPQAHVRNIGGIARHWYETGDPLDPTAIDICFDGTQGDIDPARFRAESSQMSVSRELALALMAGIDREWCGMGSWAQMDAAADALLEHIDQWTAAPGTYYGIWFKPWMFGIVCRSLIAYWGRYRDATGDRGAIVAAIPDAIKAGLAKVWDDAWSPAGSLADPEDPDSWTHGCLKYMVPASDDITLTPIEGLTVQSVSDSRTFIGPNTLSSVDGYYRYAAVVMDGVADTYQIAEYDGTTKQITTTSHYSPPTGLEVGAGFSIRAHSVEADVGPTPFPEGNLFVSPAFAWAYWHTKVVEEDEAGSIVYRTRHDALFNGAYTAWLNPYSQKVWNESLFWTTFGLDWRDRADAEWPSATTFALQAPATGAEGAHSTASGPFRLSLAYGVKTAGPVHVEMDTSSGLGTFNPASPILTPDRPWAPVQFTPASADNGEEIEVEATATGLTAPSPVAFQVGEGDLDPDPDPGTVLVGHPGGGFIASPAGGILLLYKGGA